MKNKRAQESTPDGRSLFFILTRTKALTNGAFSSSNDEAEEIMKID
jgi:hypothetical protein